MCDCWCTYIWLSFFALIMARAHYCQENFGYICDPCDFFVACFWESCQFILLLKSVLNTLPVMQSRDGGSEMGSEPAAPFSKTSPRFSSESQPYGAMDCPPFCWMSKNVQSSSSLLLGLVCLSPVKRFLCVLYPNRLESLDSSIPQCRQQANHLLRSNGYHKWNIVYLKETRALKSPRVTPTLKPKVWGWGLFQRNVE